MTVLDASAVLAFLQGEPGADEVESALPGACMSAANWSEVAQKVHSRGADWETARALLLAYGLLIEPVTAEDAERAASLWQRGTGLSLADRLCLALTTRVNVRVLTVDKAWSGEPAAEGIRIVQLR